MSQHNPMTIVVVDKDPDRYAFLNRLQARVIFLPDGRTAVRLSHSLQHAFWLVNSQLVDMPGFECIEMLVDLYPNSRFFLIDDAYDAEQERHCFRFTQAKYLCRPLDIQWLARLLQSRPTTGVNSQTRPPPESAPTPRKKRRSKSKRHSRN